MNILMNEQEFLKVCFEHSQAQNAPALIATISSQIKSYINELEERGELTPTHNDMLVLTHCFNMITIGVNDGLFTYDKALEQVHDELFNMLMTNKLGYDLFGEKCVPVLKSTLEYNGKSGE